MDIIDQKIEITRYPKRALEEQFIQMLFRINRRQFMPLAGVDFLDLLPGRNEDPFNQLRHIGVHNNQVVDIIYSLDLFFPKRLLDSITDAIFYINNDIQWISISETEAIYGISPFMARWFHHNARHEECPVRSETALLTGFVKEWLRDQGFYVPERMSSIEYRQYEQTFLHVYRKVKAGQVQK